MSPDSPLARLAVAYGIEPGYHDIWGNWHGLTETTARRVLGAMGIDASNDDAVEAALRAHRAGQWTRMLPPVCVRRESEPAWLPLTLTDVQEGAELQWRLREENGSEHRGALEAAALELLEEVDLDGRRFRRRRLQLPWVQCRGYHEVSVSCAGHEAHTKLIVTPSRCLQVAAEGARCRHWGVALQLYGVRSARNWGMGDLGDLAAAATLFGELGADLIGINPLHALYPDEPERASPYSPSSRCFANPLYLDVEAIPDFSGCTAARECVQDPLFQAELKRLRGTELVDYPGVARLKWPLLRQLYEHFRSEHLASSSSARGAAFRDFQVKGGRALRLHAIFEVLHAHIADRQWPEEYLDPDSSAVAGFARDHAADVEFHEYLQWLLFDQISHVRDCARAGGMRIGLYRDLAVGSDAFGADVWRTPQAYARQVSIGAPPDDFNLQGQVWGLPPWSPRRLEESAYADYVMMLRANMHASGALRIDHVIGLMRLFWVPAGATCEEGAFVRYPLDDLLGILALESVRAGCLIVGEDLGTVPDELRAALYDSGLLSYRVLYFSKHWHADHSFLTPDEFPAQALVTVGTHDLPTLSGYWCGRDLDVRESLDLFPNTDSRDRQRNERDLDRTRLLEALDRQGLRPQVVADGETGRPTNEMVAAVYRYIARSESAITMLQMEDVFGQVEQANVPGTVREQPNWHRRLELPLEQWAQYRPLRELARAMAQERPL
ncbi:MAG: 4-alpha-glucanotransferase [Betaproteobacteria bacterium]|nr:MAG: 4-alpha-glucanotransferase [Betaproteobacteria bacterium]